MLAKYCLHVNFAKEKGEKMSLNYVDEIISCHKSKGMLENSYGVTIIDNNIVRFNKYTLKISKIKASDIDINYYNANIIKQVRQDSVFFKEIKEFNQVFRFFDKLGIKRGYIKKTENPDFEFTKDGTSYGIEVTRIYTGNDWVAEKMHNDITAYKLENKTLKEFVSSSRYAQRVKTIQKNDGEVSISAVKDESFTDAEVVQIKNKLFEKIRKQIDDYLKFDVNYIFAEIVYSGYKDFASYEELNQEISYYVNRLDGNFGKTAFHLILKNGNNFIDFDLKNNTFKLL